MVSRTEAMKLKDLVRVVVYMSMQKLIPGWPIEEVLMTMLTSHSIPEAPSQLNTNTRKTIQARWRLGRLRRQGKPEALGMVFFENNRAQRRVCTTTCSDLIAP